jgi:hypothetical protein
VTLTLTSTRATGGGGCGWRRRRSSSRGSPAGPRLSSPRRCSATRTATRSNPDPIPNPNPSPSPNQDGDPLDVASLLQLAEGRGGDARPGALIPEAGESQSEQRTGEGVGTAIAAARLDEAGEEDWAPPHGIGGVGIGGGGLGGVGLARGTRQAGSGVWHARRNQSGARRLAEDQAEDGEGGVPRALRGEGARGARGAGAARAAAAGTWDDLDLEDAYANKISYNIGVLFMYRYPQPQP